MLKKQLRHAARYAVKQTPLAPVLRRHLRKRPLQAALDQGASDGWDEAATWLLSERGRSELSDGAFHHQIRTQINTDMDLELLLTALRRRLLLSEENIGRNASVVETVCSLVQQSLNNEYVWFVSDEEKAALQSLATPAEGLRDDGAVTWWTVGVRAMYERPERFLGGSSLSLEDLCGLDGMPSCLEEILRTRLKEVEEERALKESIPALGAIRDSTSRVVAETYEQYPYPRWLDWEIPEPGSRRTFLQRFFRQDELAFLREPFQVLVPGCGTGSKAIAWAIGYGERAHVTAVDLSRTSLAYAARMARKYGVSNIDFVQMDLLDLSSLERDFDIVECTGVLHHLKDPVAGGRELARVLRPGGIAHISLYSELSRREIARLRERYQHLIPSATEDDVRAVRRELIDEDPFLVDERLPLRWDFFDLPRCKDLLLHPMEHRFTLPQVGEYLAELGLEFRGLERPDLVQGQLWTAFPPERKRGDLAAWDAFERKNPDAFNSLYEIWALSS